MAYSVATLPAYVQENHDMLVKNFALVGAGTRPRISVQTGIKKDAYINLLNLTPALQSGEGCSFNASGDATISQRTIATANIKVNMEFCEKTLLGKYAEYLVKVNAVDNPFPFEEYITTALTNELNKKIEKLIWQGDTTSASTDLKWIDGLIKLATADVPSANKVSLTALTTMWAKVKAVYDLIPEEVLDKGAEIYVSPSQFRTFMQEMVSNNLYHYNPGNEELGEFMLPGSDVKVVRTQGLAGDAGNIFATYPANIIYGCDMENDEEKFDIWFSQDNRTWRVVVEWNSGIQIAFPDMCVLGTA